MHFAASILRGLFLLTPLTLMEFASAFVIDESVGIPICDAIDNNGYDWQLQYIDCSTLSKLNACNLMCALQNSNGCDWGSCFFAAVTEITACATAGAMAFADPIADLACASAAAQSVYRCSQCYGTTNILKSNH